MTTEDFIPELFCRIDDDMEGIEKHTQAHQSQVKRINNLSRIDK